MIRMTRRVTALALAATATSGLAVAASASKPKVGPPPPKLYAVVKPANKVTLRDAHGKTVAHLKTGWYTLTITDSVAAQRFRLKGPGVDRATAPRFVGAAIWGLHLRKGKYSYSSLGPKTTVYSFSVG
jgi:hypothetical protein